MFIPVPIPRCASRTLCWTLDQNGLPAHATAKELIDFLPEDRDQYTLLAVRRDPITRLESWFSYVGDVSFHHFIRFVLGDDDLPSNRVNDKIRKNPHWVRMPLTHWMGGTTSTDPLLVDHVLDFNNLQTEFEDLTGTHLLRNRTASSDHKKRPWTPLLRRSIQDMFQVDMDRWS